MADTYRSFKGELRNLQRKNEFIYEVELWLVNDKPNRNNWQYTDMRGNKDQFAGTPILIAYVNNGKTVGDGHNFRMEYDAQGNESPDFTSATAERIIGMISEDTNDIRVEQTVDGTQWIVSKGYIWKWYAKQAVEKIERDSKMGRPMELSIETLVTKSHMNEDGIEVEDEYTILGTTLLGDGVTPAVEGAHIVALNALASEFESLRIRAASYMSNEEEPDDPDDDMDDEEEKEEVDPDEQDDEKDVAETNQNENKTQKSNEKGETKTVKAFSKKRIAELAKKFDGYTVLSAGQEDDKIHVVLMSKDGTTAVYTMDSTEETIVPERIRKCEAQATFVGEGWELAVDTSDMIDTLSATVINVNAQLEAANADLEKANSTIESMHTKEMKRRVSAAKAKANATLEAFNANRETKVDAKILTKINEAIENGDFSECENAEGEWCGEEQVCEKVLAACAAEVMEQDKKNNSQFIWESLGNQGRSNDGDVSALLAHFGVE